MSVRDILATHPARDTFDLDELAAAIEACLDASAHCDVCAGACLGEDEAMGDCVRACLRTADVARATAAILSRPAPGGTDWRAQVEACITSTEACEQLCRQHGHDHCELCADACRNAADACRALLEAAG